MLTIKDKIVRLNTHSIAKKTARLGQQIKHEAGLKPKVGQTPSLSHRKLRPHVCEEQPISRMLS